MPHPFPSEMNVTLEDIDFFLENNSFYQNLVTSELTFAETTNLKSEFLDKVGLDNIRLYLYFNCRGSISFDLISKIPEYVEFLELYDHPDDDFVTVKYVVDKLKVASDLLDDISLNLIPKIKSEQLRKIPIYDCTLENLAYHNIEYYKTFVFIFQNQKLHIQDLDKSILIYAVKNGHYRIVKFLLDKGMKLPENILRCAKKGDTKMYKLLEDRGAVYYF